MLTLLASPLTFGYRSSILVITTYVKIALLQDDMKIFSFFMNEYIKIDYIKRNETIWSPIICTVYSNQLVQSTCIGIHAISFNYGSSEHRHTFGNFGQADYSDSKIDCLSLISSLLIRLVFLHSTHASRCARVDIYIYIYIMLQTQKVLALEHKYI
jgi:hypothetical protein